MKKNKKNPKGFTLIELLIVIAILVILAVVVILTLNPAQLLAQARDSQRISDMATLKSAITLFLADVGGSTSTANCALGTSTASTVYASANAATSTILVYTTPGTGRMPSSTANTVTTSTNNGSITGNGWIPINFSIISSGSPLGKEPIDPTNNTTALFYTYGVTGSACTFKLTAHMESTRYEAGGANDVETTDGGNSSTSYETGTNLLL